MTRIFISHSHSDREIANTLVRYLLAALNIDDSSIRCSSVPGYMLPPGTNIESHIKNSSSHFEGKKRKCSLVKIENC